MGWAPFLLPSSNSRIVMDDIMVATGVVTGAHNRRNTEKARATKAAIRAQRLNGIHPLLITDQRRRKVRTPVILTDSIEEEADQEILAIEKLCLVTNAPLLEFLNYLSTGPLVLFS